jgi:hypothetical protein
MCEITILAETGLRAHTLEVNNPKTLLKSSYSCAKIIINKGKMSTKKSNTA